MGMGGSEEGQALNQSADRKQNGYGTFIYVYQISICNI
jgi:hypothetical protein